MTAHSNIGRWLLTVTQPPKLEVIARWNTILHNFPPRLVRLEIFCCRVIIDALLRTIAFQFTRSLLPLALGKCLHLIVLGHRKPYWHITGAQPLFPWVKREWQGEIWSVTFGWQVGAQMEQRKSLRTGEHWLLMGGRNWQASSAASFYVMFDM